MIFGKDTPPSAGESPVLRNFDDKLCDDFSDWNVSIHEAKLAQGGLIGGRYAFHIVGAQS
jgi:hypothetical protein